MGIPEGKDQQPFQKELSSLGINENVEGLLDEFKQAEELTSELVQRMIDVYKILTGAAQTLYEDNEVQCAEAVASYADETLNQKGSRFSPMNVKTISVEAAKKLNELSEEWCFIEMYFENFDFIGCEVEVLAELVKFKGVLKFNIGACKGKKITKTVAEILLKRDSTAEPICLGVDEGARLGDLAEYDAMQALRNAYSFGCITSDELGGGEEEEGEEEKEGSIFEDATGSLREKFFKTLN